MCPSGGPKLIATTPAAAKRLLSGPLGISLHDIPEMRKEKERLHLSALV